MSRSLTSHTLALAVLSLAVAACGDLRRGASNTLDDDTRPLTLDEPRCATLADALARGDEWLVGMEPLDSGLRPSAAKPGVSIRLWVSSDAIDIYRGLAVDAETPTTEAFPRGAAVVREIFAADGQRTGVTATCRAQPGYNPGIGDLWFATRPSDDPAALEVGRIDSCNGCHAGNQPTYGLFGPLPYE